MHKFLPLVLFIAALPAKGTTLYTSESSFQAHPGMGSITDILISGLIGTSGTTIGPANGVTFSNATDMGLTVAASPGGWPPGGIIRRTTNGGQIDVLLPAGIQAFGAYFGQQASAFCCLSMTLTYAGGSQEFAPPGINTPVFLGLVFDTPVSSFTIAFTSPSGLNKNIAIGDMSIASMVEVSETPEGPTYLILGLGLIVLPLLKWKGRLRGAGPSVQCSP